MAILYTAFKGQNNASQQMMELLSPQNKVLLTNSFSGIEKDLSEHCLQSYEKIIMLGVNKSLDNRIQLEVNSFRDGVGLVTKVDYTLLASRMRECGIPVGINFQSTKYLCNYAYHTALSKNENSIFIHIPTKLSKISALDQFISILKEE